MLLVEMLVRVLYSSNAALNTLWKPRCSSPPVQHPAVLLIKIIWIWKQYFCYL